MSDIEPRAFGVLPDGRTVEAVTLSDGQLTATVLTWGAVLNDLRLAGVPYALTLGSPDLAPYLAGMAYFGAVVGPVANRIGGAAAEIGGRRCAFPANENGSLLHGGATGTHAQLWSLEALAPDAVTLRLDLADGLGGFPGNRTVRARYHLPEPGTLRLDISAETDAPTLMNFAHHGYWNLDGSEAYAGHRLQIHADAYLPTDLRTLPTGEVAPVENTPFDFRHGQEMHPGNGPRIDHNFCIARTRGPLRPVLSLVGQSGVRMAVESTEPGLQVFDGGNDAATAYAGHDGRGLGPYAGMALEPQAWPDAPNQPAFPAILHGPDTPYEQQTVFRFSRADG